MLNVSPAGSEINTGNLRKEIKNAPFIQETLVRISHLTDSDTQLLITGL